MEFLWKANLLKILHHSYRSGNSPGRIFVVKIFIDMLVVPLHHLIGVMCPTQWVTPSLKVLVLPSMGRVMYTQRLQRLCTGKQENLREVEGAHAPTRWCSRTHQQLFTDF